MIPASYIKKTIDFNKGFRSVLEVMKLVSVSQYHTLERKLRHFEKLEQLMPEFFASLDLSGVQHPFLNPGSQPLGVVAVTSDTGLLGGINMRVVTKAVELAQEAQGSLIVIGDKGQLYAQEMGMAFTFFPGIQDDKRLSMAYEMRDYLMAKIMQGEIGPLKVVYPKALSLAVHRVEIATLLPFAAPAASKPKTEQGTAAPSAASAARAPQLILESSPRDVMEYLVYLIMGQRLFDIFGMSRLTEQAARFTHLEESCQKITEMNQKLNLQYFRRRHEAIDANMRELYSARSSYARR